MLFATAIARRFVIFAMLIFIFFAADYFIAAITCAALAFSRRLIFHFLPFESQSCRFISASPIIFPPYLPPPPR